MAVCFAEPEVSIKPIVTVQSDSVCDDLPKTKQLTSELDLLVIEPTSSSRTASNLEQLFVILNAKVVKATRYDSASTGMQLKDWEFR